MKNRIYLILFLFFGTSYPAQSQLKPGKYNIDNGEFVVKKYDYPGQIRYSVRKLGKYEKGNPVPKDPNAIPVRTNEIHFDISKIKALTTEKLGAKLASFKKNEAVISIFLSFEQNGNVASISYILKNVNEITVNEISQIDKKIRNNIIAKFSGTGYLNFPVINYPAIYIRF
ncbi:hypothetical protein [Pedobacter psychrodurus]|uniref:hypothetical protein n=1 Tax=Pedobacter psychrodurus TaxID=2530456 RepID=UPI00292F8E98|nr:hypothetical protein [Pedobacter psychrodurus]